MRSLGRHPLRSNIERTPMLRMKTHKHTHKRRHSLSQTCFQAKHGACASSDPLVRMLLSVFTSSIRGRVASVFLSCNCFCGVFRTEISYCVLFYQNSPLENVFLIVYHTIVALGSNVILKMEITKVLYLVSNVWVFFF